MSKAPKTTTIVEGYAVSTTLAGLITSVVIIWAFAPLLLWQLFNGNTEKMGQVGDLFGSVNALFSGLAFAGLFWTVILQRHQLKMQGEQLRMQQEELKLQREEMAASRAELAHQAEAQRGLVKATAVQVAALAAQLTVEGIKLESEKYSAGSNQRNVLIDAVKAQARMVSAHAEELLKKPTGD